MYHWPAAKARVMGFKSQEIANSLWALATLKEQRSELVSKLCGTAKTKVMDLNSQEIANPIWEGKEKAPDSAFLLLWVISQSLSSHRPPSRVEASG